MAELVWSVIVAAALAVWLLATVIHQLSPTWWTRVCPSDGLGLLAHWNFFAPNPARQDTHIVYRDLQHGSWRDWHVLTSGPSARTWRWLWNPARLPVKAATDLANGLRRAAERLHGETTALMLSSSYLCLLHWVSAQAREHDVTERQFAIVTTTGFGDRRTLTVLFVSGAHHVDA
jgi:hypothetical protein